MKESKPELSLLRHMPLTVGPNPKQLVGRPADRFSRQFLAVAFAAVVAITQSAIATEPMVVVSPGGFDFDNVDAGGRAFGRRFRK